MSYPKCLYHASCEPITVKDEAQHQALGPGWAETPEAAQAAEAQKNLKPQKKADSKEGVRA